MTKAKRFANNVVIVTGAGSGIGKATALRFAEEDADVVVNDVKLERVNGLVKDIESLSGKAVPVQADVTKSDDVEKIVKVALDEFGKIDILVNNVGLFTPKRFVDIDEKRWDYMMDINLRSTFLCCMKVVPHMIERKSGKIVNISSTAGKRGSLLVADYIAAKHAVVGLTRALALELIPYNINVNAVCPGSVDTPMGAKYFEDYSLMTNQESSHVIKERTTAIPIGREAKPSEIAAVVAFLASEDSSYVVGQTILVDGGLITST